MRCRRELAPSKPKAQASTEVDAERGIAHYFFILLVQSVLDVRIASDVRGDGIPSAQVHAGISGRVVDAEAEEIGIGAAADDAGAEIRPPSGSEITQQQAPRVFGTAQQRRTCGMERIKGKGSFQNLRGVVGVAAVEDEVARETTLEFHFGAVGHGLD